MPASRATSVRAGGLELGLGVDGLVGVGDGKPHRPARCGQEVHLHAAELGHFGGCVALGANDHAIGGQEDDRAGRGRAAQLRQRHAFSGQLLEQRQALGACVALQAVEQSLGGEVGRLEAHRRAA